jgi:hypothetical protein
LGELAESFCAEFKRNFEEICADRDETFRCWREPRDWTKRMLAPQTGVLSVTAANWAKANIRGRTKPYWELRKIDLMIARLQSDDDKSWDFQPVLLVEHENAHDVEVEAWNLASRNAKLKVLIFYHDGLDDLADKKAKISRVLRAFDESEDSLSEFLLLAAPFVFGDRLKWSRAAYTSGEFSAFAEL